MIAKATVVIGAVTSIGSIISAGIRLSRNGLVTGRRECLVAGLGLSKRNMSLRWCGVLQDSFCCRENWMRTTKL